MKQVKIILGGVMILLLAILAAWLFSSRPERGATGAVSTNFRFFGPNDKIVIDGLNTFKKHARPRRQGEKGQMIVVPRPLQASKVMLICTSCKEPTRVGSRLDGAKKVRYCKKCKATI